MNRSNDLKRNPQNRSSDLEFLARLHGVGPFGSQGARGPRTITCVDEARGQEGRGSTAGTLRTVLALARPLGGLSLLVYPLVGYGFALWDHSAEIGGLGDLALLCAAWFVASAGTMWLNARLDGAESGALFAEAPTAAPPAFLGWLGTVAIGAGVVLSALAGLRVLLPCLGCAALSFLYSHPRTRWKAHPVLGPAVNALGYGTLSPLAGWAVARVPPTPRAIVVLVCIALFTLGATFAAQAFQREDDARRGYRTLVVTHGPRVCLAVTRWTTALPAAVLGALALAGYFPRLLLVGVPFLAVVDRHLRRWQSATGGGTPKLALGYMARMLGLGTIFIGLATVDFVIDLAADRPPAGLGTARGAPAPRAAE